MLPQEKPLQPGSQFIAFRRETIQESLIVAT